MKLGVPHKSLAHDAQGEKKPAPNLSYNTYKEHNRLVKITFKR